MLIIGSLFEVGSNTRILVHVRPMKLILLERYVT